jgi:hypothetical protein
VPESDPYTTVTLTPHPDAGPGPVKALRVEARWSGVAGRLSLVYRLAADPAALHLPGAAQPRRADGLWRHTCFEAFVRPGGGPGYLEFNFSPSGEWAAYRFDARREGMRLLAMTREPVPRTAGEPDGLRLSVDLQLPVAPVATLQLGLAAVIEAADGTPGYWALRHGPGTPDFHDPESFTLRLGRDATDGRA